MEYFDDGTIGLNCTINCADCIHYPECIESDNNEITEKQDDDCSLFTDKNIPFGGLIEDHRVSYA